MKQREYVVLSDVVVESPGVANTSHLGGAVILEPGSVREAVKVVALVRAITPERKHYWLTLPWAGGLEQFLQTVWTDTEEAVVLSEAGRALLGRRDTKWVGSLNQMDRALFQERSVREFYRQHGMKLCETNNGMVVIEAQFEHLNPDVDGPIRYRYWMLPKPFRGGISDVKVKAGKLGGIAFHERRRFLAIMPSRHHQNSPFVTGWPAHPRRWCVSFWVFRKRLRQ